MNDNENNNFINSGLENENESINYPSVGENGKQETDSYTTKEYVDSVSSGLDFPNGQNTTFRGNNSEPIRSEAGVKFPTEELKEEERQIDVTEKQNLKIKRNSIQRFFDKLFKRKK